MKILILVLSFTDEPYLSLMRAQQETFDSIEVEGIRTVYYYGGGKGWVTDKEFSADADDLYYRMHWKFSLALKEVIDWDWDILFRSNSSSYICKSRLKEFAKTLPTEKLYAGWKITGPEYSIVSGAGFYFSRDAALKIIESFDGEMNCEEDCLVGKFLTTEHNFDIVDIQERYDVINVDDLVPLDRIHYRFKTNSRIRDVDNMRKLHQKIINQ